MLCWRGETCQLEVRGWTPSQASAPTRAWFSVPSRSSMMAPLPRRRDGAVSPCQCGPHAELRRVGAYLTLTPANPVAFAVPILAAAFRRPGIPSSRSTRVAGPMSASLSQIRISNEQRRSPNRLGGFRKYLPTTRSVEPTQAPLFERPLQSVAKGLHQVAAMFESATGFPSGRPPAVHRTASE